MKIANWNLERVLPSQSRVSVIHDHFAPCAASVPPSGAKMVTPKAMAEGSATSIAAKPPQISPGNGFFARPAADVAGVAGVSSIMVQTG